MNNIQKILNVSNSTNILTTPIECQNRIDNMKQLLEQFANESQIQFPVYNGPNANEKQFRHYSVNRIQNLLIEMNKEITNLQDELNRYNIALKS